MLATSKKGLWSSIRVGSTPWPFFPQLAFLKVLKEVATGDLVEMSN